MSKEKPVYSTSGNGEKAKLKPKKAKRDQYTPSSGPTKMRLEKKGRGGKVVTILYNLPFAEGDARDLMKELQVKFACGASFKAGEILLRGDMRSGVDDFFKERQLKLVRSGG